VQKVQKPTAVVLRWPAPPNNDQAATANLPQSRGEARQSVWPVGAGLNGNSRGTAEQGCSTVILVSYRRPRGGLQTTVFVASITTVSFAPIFAK
jgi:hypothetical protein